MFLMISFQLLLLLLLYILNFIVCTNLNPIRSNLNPLLLKKSCSSEMSHPIPSDPLLEGLDLVKKTLIVLEMLLINKKGTVIQRFISHGRFKTYLPQMKQGSVYKLNNFYGSKKIVYRVSDHAVTVSFSWNSGLSVLRDSTTPFDEDSFRDATVCVSVFDSVAELLNKRLEAVVVQPKVMVATSINPKFIGGRLYLNATSVTHFYFDDNEVTASQTLFEQLSTKPENDSTSGKHAWRLYEQPTNLADVVRRPDIDRTMFTAWMVANETYEETRELTFAKFPSRFT